MLNYEMHLKKNFMKFHFPSITPPHFVEKKKWFDSKWQFQNSLKTRKDFEKYFTLSEEEKKTFLKTSSLFQVRTTPYYALLAQQSLSLRRTLIPSLQELQKGSQQMKDPLGENRYSPVARLIHRYTDRVLFLVTDFCALYCRYCLRKHFTGQGQAMIKSKDYFNALDYIKQHKQIREIILSGGDPFTLSNQQILKIVKDLRQIDHVEIIRIASRVPAINPMRIEEKLFDLLKPYHPIYVMMHFNHPKEITLEVKKALSLMADRGFPLFNQMVLLRGVNNHPIMVQALSRRLLYLRVKPYYMFQVDPSEGTDHFRISVEESQDIQKSLWGRLSGLALPQLSLDIPEGGGKVGFVPDFLLKKEKNSYFFQGWDGVKGVYKNPESQTLYPEDVKEYEDEWQLMSPSPQRENEVLI